MARTKPWEVSDEVWERVRPLIPAAPSHAKGGRRRMDDRKAFEAIVYVLRTGIQWNALPRELGASSTVHDRFQEWERAGYGIDTNTFLHRQRKNFHTLQHAPAQARQLSDNESISF